MRCPICGRSAVRVSADEATLGREVRLKFLPSLEVLEDTTAAYGERIEQLLREAGVSKPPVVKELEEPLDD